uniref:Cytochrome c oxidase subunit 3 n=1 Tax=Pallaseopsis kessleri TaxID=686709 RepID=A0A1L5BW63_9CRUS|nr:cytochrome c oxidase subunit III [Pallaseopsis kessleri]APL97200.1 cytochrome c oxidase subunit III [Pallaseopsis kessleri]
MTTSNHPYHLVEKSPWPILVSLSTLLTAVGLVKLFKHTTPVIILVSMVAMLMISALWWRDVSREATLMGCHTIKVANGLRLGMLLFILSEVLFFTSFFWAFFHSSLNPTMELGGSWPPQCVYTFSPFQIPLLNTAVLLASGVTVTWAHYTTKNSAHKPAVYSLLLTITLGIYFSTLQVMEYHEAPFTFADSVYGSTFFIATGFHGVHVLVGTMFLANCLVRLYKGHFSSYHHTGLELAIWYWHFVDVVWLLLYTSIYWWGS